MYSVLIPNFNNIRIRSLLRQIFILAEYENVAYEIILLDDGSHINELNSLYKEIGAYPNIHCFRLPENKGRTYTRNYLAKIAKYQWLLFLDSDVIPSNDSFLTEYVQAMQKEDSDVLFGGVEYKFILPNPTNENLHWLYGLKREAKDVFVRKKFPYQTVISTCFAIKKDVFMSIDMPNQNRYGMDYYFANQLKKMKLRVTHINSRVQIMSFNTTDDFLHKRKLSIETLHHLFEEKLISADATPLLKANQKLEKWRIKRIFHRFIGLFENSILKNLKSDKPNLFLFDLYRLNLFIRLTNASN